MLDKQNIEVLLSKVISEKILTNIEVKQLQEWVAQSSENRVMLDNIYYSLKEAKESDSNTVSYMFESVMRKVKTAQRRRQYRLALLGVAAIASCLVLAVLIWPHQESAHIAYEASDAIILSDNTGKTIDIESLSLFDINDTNIKVDIDNKSVDFSCAEQKNDAIDTELPVKQFTLQVPNAKELNIVLPDGTKVWINAGSKISFPESFKGGSREVNLIGEAYFDVVYDQLKPFIVQTAYMSTQVYGTEFIVSAYSNDFKQSVSLVDGSIGVTADSKYFILRPGEGVEYDLEKETTSRFEVNVDDVSLSMQKLFIFNDVDLATIAKRLEKWYGLEIEFENKELAKTRYYVKIDKYDNIINVLELLKNTGHIDYQYQDNNVVFMNSINRSKTE